MVMMAFILDVVVGIYAENNLDERGDLNYCSWCAEEGENKR